MPFAVFVRNWDENDFGAFEVFRNVISDGEVGIGRGVEATGKSYITHIGIIPHSL